MATLREIFEMKRGQLDNERQNFIPHYKEITSNILPRKGKYLEIDTNRGGKKYNSIIDNTATMASRTLRSGMMAGVTSPARPWFKVGTPDPDLMKFAPVKQWLHQLTQLKRDIFQASNLYNALPNCYEEIGNFATGPIAVLDDFDNVIRCVPFTAGEYMIATSEKQVVDTIYRDISMTVIQMVKMFGKDNVGTTVKMLYDKDQWFSLVPVTHAVEPNNDELQDRIAEASDGIMMERAFRSVYYERGESSDKMLGVNGFDRFPVLCPRWHVRDNGAYGDDCPGMIALGDVKQLQMEQKRKAQGIDKMVNPPLVGPPELKNKPVSSLPGGLTTTTVPQGHPGLQPIYMVNPQLGELKEDIMEVQNRINRAYYVDLFLMLANTDRREITAREIEERHEEKLLQLGPVLERLNDELLDPLIEITFEKIMATGLLPDPPQELDNVELKVEYISIMAQAQRAVGTAGIDRVAGFIGGIAGAKGDQSPWDKFNDDEAIDEYADMVGIPPKVVRSQDDTDVIREARAQQEQMQQRLAMAGAAADAAAKAGEVKTDERNVVADVLGGRVAGAPS